MKILYARQISKVIETRQLKRLQKLKNAVIKNSLDLNGITGTDFLYTDINYLKLGKKIKYKNYLQFEKII